MNIKDAAKQVEAKLETEMNRPQSLTVPMWIWATIGVSAVIIVMVVLHG